MKVTNNQVVNANNTLQRLAPAISDTVVRFRIMQAIKTFASPLESWEELRKGIIDTYAKKDDNGQPETTKEGFIVWQEDKADDATKELTDLGGIEVELSITPIKLSRFAASLKEAPDYAAIQTIDWLIEDDLE